MRWLVLVLALIFAGTTASAQPRRTPAERREAIKKRIRALRAAELVSRLSLDADTAGKLLPVLAKYDDELEKLLQQKVDLGRQLDAGGASRDARAIDHLIDDAVANQRALWTSEERRLGEVRKILTPQQVATMLIVLPQWERKIQNQLRRAIENARTGPAAPSPRLEDEDGGADDERPAPPPRKPSQPPAKLPKCDPYSARGC